MSVIKPLVVTTEGVSAAVAQDNLSLQLAITHIALHDGTNEIKRMAVMAGDDVADDMIHATILDMTDDAYSVKRIELYANTVLFAYYEQSSTIIEKTSATSVIVPADFKLTTVPPGSVTIGGNQFSYPPASETLKGVSRVATQEKVVEGLDDEDFLTSKKAAAHFYHPENPPPSDVPPGTVLPFAGENTPSGYLRANNGIYSRATYAELFSAVGTRYGNGDGETTFNVPEVRGEHLRFWDDGRGIDAGRNLGSFQSDSIKSHTITLPRIPLASQPGGNAPGFLYDNSNYPVSSQSVQVSGSNETRGRNIAFLGIIKY